MADKGKSRSTERKMTVEELQTVCRKLEVDLACITGFLCSRDDEILSFLRRMAKAPGVTPDMQALINNLRTRLEKGYCSADDLSTRPLPEAVEVLKAKSLEVLGTS